ncbi:MAG TPA: DUF1702 family protein [Allosphingosinicella sp.]|jgi:hypothetical protein
MLNRGSINIDFDPKNNSAPAGASAAVRNLLRTRLEAARLGLFGISPHEAEFDVRGFRSTTTPRRDRLETVGRSFIAGYNAAVATGRGEAALEQLPGFPEDLRGFVVEGAAMGLAMLDLVTPWPRRGFAAFVAGPAKPYVYLAYVGAGWALARTSWRLRGRLGRVDPLLRWLMMDGYGFHSAYFQADRSIDLHRRPSLPAGYAARAFDQGLGRGLWFAMGASGGAVRSAVESFVPERRADLWSGIGLAASYAGGAGTRELTDLAQVAGGFRLELAQGAAFAAAAHLEGGAIPSHTDSACQVLCGMDARSAAAITSATRPNPASDGDGFHYEAWRAAIRTAIFQHQANGARGRRRCAVELSA